jgi:hypothetical protein
MKKSASLSPNKYKKSCIRSAASSPKRARVVFAKNLVKVARLSDNDSYVYDDPESSIVENRIALKKMYYTDKSSSSSSSHSSNRRYRV